MQTEKESADVEVYQERWQQATSKARKYQLRVQKGTETFPCQYSKAKQVKVYEKSGSSSVEINEKVMIEAFLTSIEDLEVCDAYSDHLIHEKLLCTHRRSMHMSLVGVSVSWHRKCLNILATHMKHNAHIMESSGDTCILDHD